MHPTGPRISLEELARRGDELFARFVRPKLRPEDHGKFVAVDVETGDYELDADDYAAVARLRRRIQDAQPWLVRVGYPAAQWLRTPR